MDVPLKITFHHVSPSPALEANIRQRAEKLEQICDHIISCRVVVESPHKHHQQGNLYQVRIAVNVPDAELFVNRSKEKNQAHEDAYVAIRDAFDAMRRQLEGYVRERRGDVKAHIAPPQGRVSELYPAMDYGKIATIDAREIYFHRNSVLNADFDALEIGTAVRFAEEMGEEGPKATSVHVLSKGPAV